MYGKLPQKRLIAALITTVLAFLVPNVTLAGNSSLPDDHAPAGIMGDHLHKPGEWMFSYRYMRMEMDGNRDGTDDLSSTRVLSDFMVAPLDMTAEMHMFGFMYGITDGLTMMAMGPYVKKSMSHLTRAGEKFETETEGLGDIKLLGLFSIYDSTKSDTAKTERGREDKIHVNLGISLPTGSTNKRGNTPAGTGQKLPYPMQIGSGTYDPVVALTWLRRYPDWSMGLQSDSVLRFGENDEGYRRGNEHGVSIWVAKNLNNHVSVSLRVDGEIRRKINGDDYDLNPKMVPTARPDLSGRKSVYGFAGLNFYKSKGRFSGNRLAVEMGLPLYEDLDGPQLKTDYSLSLSWQLAIR